MSPSPEEIAALLALPAEAREALTKCEGPGWRVLTWGEGMWVDGFWRADEPRDHDAENVALGAASAWLPADTAEILDMVRWRTRSRRVLIEVSPDDCEASWRDRSGRTHRGHGATARLAALRLLAVVWGLAPA